MPTVRLKGDFGKLRKMAATAARAPEVRGAVAKTIAEETVNLIKDGFREEKDPYGRAWKKKKRPDGRKVLSGKTGRLKGFTPVTATASLVVVSPTVSYAKFHQGGTRFLPVRAMIPTTGRGLPSEWVERYREAYEDAMKSLFGG